MIIYDEVVPWISENLIKELRVGGALIAPVADSKGVGNMVLIEKTSETEVICRDLTGNVDDAPEVQVTDQVLDMEDEELLNEQLNSQMMVQGPYSWRNPELDASYMFLMDRLAPRDRKRDKFKKFLKETFGTDDADKLLAEQDEVEGLLDSSETFQKIMHNVYSTCESPKPLLGDSSDVIMNLPTDKIYQQFNYIEDLSKKALLAVDNQTFARKRIKNLTLRLMHKLKKKGKLDKKGKKVMMGQMILKSRVGSKLFDYADLMPFGETAVEIEPWTSYEKDKDQFINASYIKTAFGEEKELDEPMNVEEDENVKPFGLMIATAGPNKNTIEQFWKMVIQQDVSRIVALCEKMGDECGVSPYKEACQYFPTEEKEIQITDVGKHISIHLKVDPSKTVITPHVRRRTIKVTYQYQESEGSPVISGEKEVQHVHYTSWVDMGVPNSPEAIDALLEIAEKDGACFLSE